MKMTSAKIINSVKNEINSVKIIASAENLVAVHTHTHTHTHTSSLEIKKKNNKFFAEKLAKKESIKDLINIKVKMQNKMEKRSRNIISCEYIDTG